MIRTPTGYISRSSGQTLLVGCALARADYQAGDALEPESTAMAASEAGTGSAAPAVHANDAEGRSEATRRELECCGARMKH